MGVICTIYKVVLIKAGFFFLFVKPGLKAQRLPVTDVLTMEQGLSFRHISGIAQDKNGLMWFATTNGLSRYDGYRFVNFGKKASGNNYFPAQQFAPEGIRFINDSILWAIADARLWAMNIRNFHTQQVPGIRGNVLKMVPGKNKDTWLVSDDSQEQFLWR